MAAHKRIAPCMRPSVRQKRDPAFGRVRFNARYRKIYGNELLIVLYVSPILGPITRTTATTRTATRVRMIAYSIRP